MTVRRSRFILAAILTTLALIGAGCAKSEPGGAAGDFTRLSDVLGNGLPTLAQFGAEGSVTCKEMVPELDRLANEYEGRLNVAYEDIYQDRDLSRMYVVNYVPTQIIFDSQGKRLTFEYLDREVDRHTGFWSKEDMVAHLTSLGLL